MKKIVTILVAVIGFSLTACQEPALNPKSSEKAITAFSFANLSATVAISESTRTISVTVPNGTNVIGLTPTVTVSQKADYTPKGAQNFTNSVTYTVTAEDGSVQNYTVTVTIAPPNGTEPEPETETEPETGNRTFAEIKADALSALNTLKTSGSDKLNYNNYYSAQQKEIRDYLDIAINLVNAATTEVAVLAALDTVEANIDAVKTKATVDQETSAQALTDAKTTAINALEFYKTKLNDYDANDRSYITGYINQGTTKINGATTIPAVNDAKDEYLGYITIIKTTAQKAAEAQAAAEAAAKELADAKKTAGDSLDVVYGKLSVADYYDENDWNLVVDAYNDGKSAINAATSTDGVTAALSAAKSAIAAVPKKIVVQDVEFEMDPIWFSAYKPNAVDRAVGTKLVELSNQAKILQKSQIEGASDKFQDIWLRYYNAIADEYNTGTSMNDAYSGIIPVVNMYMSFIIENLVTSLLNTSDREPFETQVRYYRDACRLAQRTRNANQATEVAALLPQINTLLGINATDLEDTIEPLKNAIKATLEPTELKRYSDALLQQFEDFSQLRGWTQDMGDYANLTPIRPTNVSRETSTESAVKLTTLVTQWYLLPLFRSVVM